MTHWLLLWREFACLWTCTSAQAKRCCCSGVWCECFSACASKLIALECASCACAYKISWGPCLRQWHPFFIFGLKNECDLPEVSGILDCGLLKWWQGTAPSCSYVVQTHRHQATALGCVAVLFQACNAIYLVQAGKYLGIDVDQEFKVLHK